jgi:exopolysaccharide biosynthesis protein
MNQKRFWRVFRIVYSILFAAFTAYVILDAFVIPRSYAVVTETSSSSSPAAKTAASQSSGTKTADSPASSVTPVSTGTSYIDGGISIALKTYRVDNTNVYVADVTLASADLLKTAFANNTFGKNIKAATSAIASANSAILAINGDFYGSQNDGYVIRNGTLYRSTAYSSDREDLVIGQDGSFRIIQEGNVSAQELLESGAWQVLSFGPALVENSAVAVTSADEVAKAMATNPRTAIGTVGDLHYVFVVSDGRTSASTGLSLKQLADFMQGELGCTTAYNLDGGGSSTMYFNGKVVNNPTTNGSSISERSVSDIVYIKAS